MSLFRRSKVLSRSVLLVLVALLLAAPVTQAHAQTHAPARPLLPGSNVLGAGVVLTDAELQEIEGEGLTTALVFAVEGAILGAGSYTAAYIYDAYIEPSAREVFNEPEPEDEEDPEWSWTAFYGAAFAGAFGGFIKGLLTPTP